MIKHFFKYKIKNKNNLTFQENKHIFLFSSPVLLVGETGVGKSETVEQFARENGYEFFNIRLSELELSDLTGIPRVDGEFVKFVPVEFSLIASKKKTVLFFDELNRAQFEVRQVIFRVADSYQINGLRLHPETKIIAAINPDNGRYIVETLEAAEQARWAIVEFHPSLPAWFDWLLRSEFFFEPVYSFLQTHNSYIEKTGIERAGIKGETNRRLWTRLMISLFNFYFPKKSNPDSRPCLNSVESHNLVYKIAEGYVGGKIAKELMINIIAWEENNKYNPLLLDERKTIQPWEAERVVSFFYNMPIPPAVLTNVICKLSVVYYLMPTEELKMAYKSILEKHIQTLMDNIEK